MDANIATGQTYTATVEGMTCGNCALTISKLLEKKGMTNVAANAASGEVSFTMPEATSVDQIYDAIDSLGYKVVRDQSAHTVGRPSPESHVETRLLQIAAIFTVPLLLHMFLIWPLLHNPWVQLVLATPVYAIGCYVFMPSAFRSLKHRIPNMDVLIILGASAAYIYSIIGLLTTPEHAHHFLFFETTASIITLVLFGNWLEHRTVKATTVAIDALVQLQPQTARLVMVDSIGKETVTDVESRFVRSGDLVQVNQGDSVPVDGAVVSGAAEVDERMITGESLSVSKKAGDIVVGGTLVVEGSLKVKATTVGNSSVLSSIVRMVREAQSAKPPLQKLADKISAVFVPLVLGISLLTFVVNYFLVSHSIPESMMRAIAVMVISCPCAMGLATPAAIAVGLGRAARNGMLVKGSQTLELMKTIRTVVFDKTGTLTTGNLNISSVVVSGIDEQQFRDLIVAIERQSSHPIAQSILREWQGGQPAALETVTEIKGKGMEARDKLGQVWRLGSERWLYDGGGPYAGYDLYLFEDCEFRGALKLIDSLRPDAKETIDALHRLGYRTVLLSGDKQEKCADVASRLGIREVYGNQSPEQKNKMLDAFLQEAPTAMVGDGINDAPALARATVGISLSESSNIAIQSADVILSGNKLSALPQVIRLGILTEQTIRQNLFWAFLYNIIAIPVAAMGYLSPTWGALIMAMSDVVLIINSLRLRFRAIQL